jgi:hypothetical protein
MAKKVAKVLGLGSGSSAKKVVVAPPPEAEKPPAEIPDEDVVKRNAARYRRGKSTGRSSTLLADDDGDLG